MVSPLVDTFKDTKYVLLALTILIVYGVLLLYFGQFLFFAPYLTFYVPLSGVTNLILDFVLTILTTVVLTVSVRQILLH